MKQTVSEIMATWNEFLMWCNSKKKTPGLFTSIQEFISQNDQDKLSC